jgi:hypothetical protein
VWAHRISLCYFCQHVYPTSTFRRPATPTSPNDICRRHYTYFRRWILCILVYDRFIQRRRSLWPMMPGPCHFANVSLQEHPRSLIRSWQRRGLEAYRRRQDPYKMLMDPTKEGETDLLPHCRSKFATPALHAISGLSSNLAATCEVSDYESSRLCLFVGIFWRLYSTVNW